LRPSSVGRALLAALRKDFTIALRYPIDLIGSFAASALMVLLLVMAAKPFIPGGQGFPPDFALSVGWGGFLILLSTSPLYELSISVRQEKINGTLEQIFLSPSPKLALLIGRALRSQILSVLYGVGYLASAAYALGGLQIQDLPLGIYYLLLGIPVFYGLGFVVLALTFDIREIIPAVTMLQIGLVFLSGILLPFDMMPGSIRVLAIFMPTSYSIDLFRSAIAGSRPELLYWLPTGSALFLESAFAHIVAVVLPLVGILTFRITIKRAKHKGGLQQG
jgi:ABC-type multidrug transport system permease subunit